MFTLGKIAEKVVQRPHIEMLDEDNVRKGFFERAEFHAVLTELSQDLRPVFEVAYLTGWRVKSEILSRQACHLNLDAGWLRLEPGETKNREGRMFPLTPELREVLHRQVARNEAIQRDTGQIIPWLFHRNGAPIRSFRRAWVGACRRVGLVGRIPHDFRRTAVRNLERAGVPRSAAMAMVGHKTESIYRRYAIADETMLRESGEKLAKFHRAESALESNVIPLKHREQRRVPAGQAAQF
jgi:integrase